MEAWKEQERRAKSYASLFKLHGWKGKELLSLAQLYSAAGRNADAEKAYALYQREPRAPELTLARKGLVSAFFAQEKWGEALPIVDRLLDEPVYDQDIILLAQTLIDALRITDPQSAIAISEKMLPGVFRYAEGKAASPHLSGHAAMMLVYALEPATIYRQRGDAAKADVYITAFMSRFTASPLASNKMIREIVEAQVLRARLLGEAAPPIEGVEYMGIPKMSLDDLKGKVVMLDFWAHWCAPCIANFPALNALRAKYGPQGLVIIGVTETYGFLGDQKGVSTADELAALKKLRKEHNIEYGFIVGPHQNQVAYGVLGLPAVALIDRAGKVRYVKSGTGEGRAFERTIESLLAEARPTQ